MKVKIGVSSFGKFFTVPCKAVENYLKLADGDFYKVLMCVLCSNDDTADVDEIAVKCRLTAAQVEDALLFWADKNVISVQGLAVPAAASVGAVSANTGTNTAAENVTADNTAANVSGAESVGTDIAHNENTGANTAAESGTADTPTPPPEKKKPARTILRIDNKEILKRRENEPEIKWLFTNIQNVFSKPPNSIEMAALLKLYDLYKFDVPTILIIARYVQDNCKTAAKIAKMEKLADDWFVDNICTYKQVEADIERRIKYNTVFEKFKRCLEIDFSLTKAQEEIFAQWVDYGFNEIMLEIAYERFRNEGGKKKIPYINGILKKWYDKKIFTPEAAKIDDEKHKAEKEAAANNNNANYPKDKPKQKRKSSLKSSFNSDSIKLVEELALKIDPNRLAVEEDNQ